MTTETTKTTQEDPRDDTYILTVDTGTDDEVRSAMEAALQDMGWDVDVRTARRGEIPDAVYVVTTRGDRQILGHTVPVPEELRHAMSVAWEVACERPAK